MLDRLWLGAALLSACLPHPPPEVEVSAAHRWEVYDGRDLILTVSDQPGALTSTAPPPPGGAVRTHPFLSAAASSAAHEAHLGALLQGAEDVPGFLQALHDAGYRVVPVE